MKAMAASQFVLVYDAEAQKLESHDKYPDPEVAAKAYFDAERRYADQPQIHVVMLSANSLEDLATTHRTYFQSSEELVKQLSELADRADGRGP
jgi:hypothetical protein